MTRLLTLPAFLAVAAFVAAEDAKPTVVKINSLSAPAPTGWSVEKPANRLRSFQFKLPAAAEGGHSGEIYGMADSNSDHAKYFARWKNDFVVPEGKTADDIAKTTTLDLAGGTKAYLLDMTGTWRFKERPFDPRSKTEERPDYRVVWAVVNGPDASTHLRMSGPAAVVDKQYDSFVNWLKALK